MPLAKHPHFMQSLKEQEALIGMDPTPETVEILKQEVAPDLHARAEELFASIETILNKEQASEEEVNEILDEESAAVDTGGTEEIEGIEED